MVLLDVADAFREPRRGPRRVRLKTTCLGSVGSRLSQTAKVVCLRPGPGIIAVANLNGYTTSSPLTHFRNPGCAVRAWSRVAEDQACAFELSLLASDHHAVGRVVVLHLLAGLKPVAPDPPLLHGADPGASSKAGQRRVADLDSLRGELLVHPHPFAPTDRVQRSDLVHMVIERGVALHRWHGHLSRGQHLLHAVPGDSKLPGDPLVP